MDYFEYRDGRLFCEEADVSAIADDVGTPFYLYSARTVEHHYRQIDAAFAGVEHLVCYSIKSNANLALLALLAKLGSGFDAVSGGEIFRALKAGANPRRIVYAGVGKTDAEIEMALRTGILMLNVESRAELENIDRIAARLGARAPVALRVNPDVDPKTHRHITTGKKENKFGIDLVAAGEVLRDAKRFANARISGIHAHIGSQITSVDPYIESFTRVADFIQENRSVDAPIEYFNGGGGFGIFYDEQKARPVEQHAEAVVPIVRRTGCKLLLEPGRYICGNAGILVARVLYVKRSGEKTFAIVDAGMNDLIRPALYDAFHFIWPARCKVAPQPRTTESVEALRLPGIAPTDIVGRSAKAGLLRPRPPPAAAGARRSRRIFSAGAYGFTMSSNYNARPRPPEILVNGGAFRVVRERETHEQLVAGENT